MTEVITLQQECVEAVNLISLDVSSLKTILTVPTHMANVCCRGRKKSEPVPSMPGVHRSSIDELVKKASEAMRLKIPAAIFPSIEKSKKDEIGSLACDETNLVCHR